MILALAAVVVEQLQSTTTVATAQHGHGCSCLALMLLGSNRLLQQTLRAIPETPTKLSPVDPCPGHCLSIPPTSDRAQAPDSPATSKPLQKPLQTSTKYPSWQAHSNDYIANRQVTLHHTCAACSSCVGSTSPRQTCNQPSPQSQEPAHKGPAWLAHNCNCILYKAAGQLCTRHRAAFGSHAWSTHVQSVHK